ATRSFGSTMAAAAVASRANQASTLRGSYRRRPTCHRSVRSPRARRANLGVIAQFGEVGTHLT
ncbi:hypothetical protein ACIKT0_18055, partial [Hansschlegelia beijingensis]|uniref:hypothetical protein n=1 Tax=Hansschlegelia beijingensis TaxID=1133344 RepID=UPI00387F1302